MSAAACAAAILSSTAAGMSRVTEDLKQLDDDTIDQLAKIAKRARRDMERTLEGGNLAGTDDDGE